LDKTKDEEKDVVEKIDDIEILVEKDLLDHFGNLNIDYSKGWFNKGFTVTV